MAEEQTPTTEETTTSIGRFNLVGRARRALENTTPIQWAMGVLIGLFVLFGLGIIFALVVGLVFEDEGAVAAVFSILRDVFIIMLAIQGMIITVALIILILQVARLVNLLENEVNPTLENLRQTSQTLRGTSDFISENISAPFIETQAAAAGMSKFLRELYGLRRATKRQNSTNEAKHDEATE